jgi:FSR family fosmidomycin resistance protein-like MFS transporter
MRRTFLITLLGAEFLAEWFSNLLAAVLPIVRAALGLSYAQAGLLFTLLEGGDVVSDGVFGVVGEFWPRRLLIAGGALTAGIALAVMGLAPIYWVLAVGVAVWGLSGGPLIGLSEASLVDDAPEQAEKRIAWFTLSGDLGYLVAPVMAALAFALGASWRPLFFIGTGLLLLYSLAVLRLRFRRRAQTAQHDESAASAGSRWAALKAAALDRALLRWAMINPLLDLPLSSFLVLYFHDVVGLSTPVANSALVVWIVAGLAGRALLPWLLRRVAGVRLLRLTIELALLCLAAFLLAPPVWAKYLTLAVLRFIQSNWYPLAQAQAYATRPEASGVVLSVTSLISPITSLLPLLIGAIANAAGLSWGLAALLIGPALAALLLPSARHAR